MFSRVQFEGKFVIDYAENFATELKKHYDHIEIQWRRGLKKTDEPIKADSLKIKVNGKLLFSQNKKMTVFILGNTQGKSKEVLDAYKKAGYKIERPNPILAYLCSIIYFVVFCFGFIARPEFAIYFIIALISMILGILVYSKSQKAKFNDSFTGSNIGSWLFFIGFIMTAPASMLMIFLFQYIGVKAFYREVA